MWGMPPLPPELLRVMGPNPVQPTGNVAPPNGALAQPYGPPRIPPPAPIRMGPGGVNLAPKDPNPAPFLNQTTGTMEPLPTGSFSPAAKASDDPGINSPMPTPPDQSNSPVMGAYKRFQDLTQQREALQPPTRADYKPNWKDRLKGGLIGGIVGLGGGAALGTRVGSGITERKFNNAQSDYESKSGALDKAIENERGGFGAAEAVGKIPQQDFENKMKVRGEQRQESRDTANEQYKSDLNNVRQSIADQKHEDAMNKLDQLQKQLDQKTGNDKDKLDLQRQLLELRRDALDAREGKAKSNTTSVNIESKKAAALQKAKTQFDKEMANAPDEESKKQAQDNYSQAQQEAQDAYEAEIQANGGTANHQDVSTWQGKPAAAAPPAAKPGPSTPPAPTKSGKQPPKVGDPVTLKGGKTGKVTKLYPDGTFDVQ